MTSKKQPACENCNGTYMDPDYAEEGLPGIPCHVCMDERAPHLGGNES